MSPWAFGPIFLLLAAGNTVVAKPSEITPATATMLGELAAEIGLPRGTIKATVLIETLHAAFEMEEILYELRHHAYGLSLDPQAYAADHIALFTAPIIRPTNTATTMTPATIIASNEAKNILKNCFIIFSGIK